MLLGDRGERRLEPALDLLASLEELLLAVDLECREACGDAHLMTRVGVTARQRLRIERRRELFSNHHSTERQICRRDALREREHVGHDAEALRAERCTRATEAGHDLVADEKDA